MAEDSPVRTRVASPRSAEQVAQAIEQMIADNGLTPGDRVGAERELAEAYGVSRWVIRKALERLEADARVLRTHGRSGGIFVAPKKVVRDLNPLLGLPQYLRAQGIEAGTTIMGTRAGPTSEQVAKELNVSPDTWVFQIDRLRLAGGLPLSLESVYFPAELFPGLLDQPLVGSIYDLLESQYGVQRGEAVETITATPANREEAATLQVSVGAPLLAVNRTAAFADGQVFEFSRELYRSDRTAITVRTSGGGAATRHVRAPNAE